MTLFFLVIVYLSLTRLAVFLVVLNLARFGRFSCRFRTTSSRMGQRKHTHEIFANGMFAEIYRTLPAMASELCSVICGYALENMRMQPIENVAGRSSPIVLKQGFEHTFVSLKSCLDNQHYGLIGASPLSETNSASFTVDINLHGGHAPYLLTIGVSHDTRATNPTACPFDIDDWGAITALTFVSSFGKARSGYWSAVGSNRRHQYPVASAGTLAPLNYGRNDDNLELEQESLPLAFSVTIHYDYTLESIVATIRYSDSVFLPISIAPHDRTKISNLLPYLAFRAESNAFPLLSISSPF